MMGIFTGGRLVGLRSVFLSLRHAVFGAAALAMSPSLTVTVLPTPPEHFPGYHYNKEF